MTRETTEKKAAEIPGSGRTLVERYALPPDMIEPRSFAIIAELLADFDQTEPEWPVVQRIVHTTGDPAVACQIRIHERAVAAGTQALRSGRPILTDVKMVAAGISRGLASQFGCEVLCAIDDPAVAEIARAQRTTRGVASVRHLADRVPGAVVAIGNAPTALFALLDCLDGGLPPPALVVGTPVGFVGAAEAKAELVRRTHLPYVTIEGTRGGSSIAAATVNALLRLAAKGL